MKSLHPIHNSKNQLIHPTEQGISNFWKWFKSSKTVDSKNRPIVFYHGTALAGYNDTTDIEFFDKNKIGDRWGADNTGFFFGDKPLMANYYASSDFDYRDKGRGQGAVYPVYIKADKPLIIDDSFLRKEGMNPLGEKEDCISFWDVYQDFILTHHDQMKSDSIILIDNIHKASMIVSFKAENIKSAIGNSGEFNPNEKLLTEKVIIPVYENENSCLTI